MKQHFFVEVDCQQKSHHKERICGDVFISRKIKEENRIILVLSDGMGHGVKANMLSTLTATMALNFTREHKEPEKTAEIIMKTLPECSERKMNYSTFTVVDIELDGETSVLEYDNPECLFIRDKKIVDLQPKVITFDNQSNRNKQIRLYQFEPRQGDRIIITSDGIPQSGMGTPIFPFGWGNDNIGRFALDIIRQYPQISARELATRILNMAYRHDGFQSKDDSSCLVVYFREPRPLLICTGPPFEDGDDSKLALAIKEFRGKKIIMGATTGDIIARELNLKIGETMRFEDPDLPPVCNIEGIDLYTEGILTLNKAEKILKNYHSNYIFGKGPADEVVKLILESDDIQFLVGTRINVAHQDPTLPVELEIRRTVVNRVARILEEKYMKDVRIKYI